MLLKSLPLIRVRRLSRFEFQAFYNFPPSVRIKPHRRTFSVASSFNSKHSTDEKLRTSDLHKRTAKAGEAAAEGSSSYCFDLVRKHEYENFLCTLLLKTTDARRFVFAVRSFNVEIALIRDQVSQRDIGLGRLAFWREAVNKVFKNNGTPLNADIPRHPVVLELHSVLKDKNVSKKWFINLLDARERVMNDAAFKDIEELEAYCDKSLSPILFLSFEAFGIKNVDTDHAASHLGKALGLVNFIRSIPYNSQHRRILVPHDLLLRHKLSQEDFLRVRNKEKIQDAVFEIASQAHLHYNKAQSLKKTIPKEALPFMLIGTPADIYLKRLQNAQFNPYDPSLVRRYGLLPLHLYFRKFTGKF